MCAVNNGMVFIRSLRTFHNNISHQTQKIRIKVHFHLFSIVNVNRTTLSSSYCNDCLEMISPHLNDRPIFSYRHQPISIMVITKAALQQWFYWSRPLYRYNFLGFFRFFRKGFYGFSGAAPYIGIMA